MTFVISAFKMYALHFGHFRKPEKLGSYTGSKWWPCDPDAKDDPNDPSTRWPGDPVPCLVHSTWTKLNWSELSWNRLNWPAVACNKSTQLHDAFIGHARQRHDLIGYCETRTASVQRVLGTIVHCGCSHWGLVQFSLWAVNVNPPLAVGFFLHAYLLYSRSSAGDKIFVHFENCQNATYITS